VTVHPDILDAQESLRRPALYSLAAHIALAAALTVQSFVGSRPREIWGSPNSLGGSSVGITPVSQVPLPSRGGPVNPLANDTESAVPTPPPSKQAPKKQAVRVEDAIALKSKSKSKQSSLAAASQRSALKPPETTGQLYSSMGQRLSSPMVGETGAGGARMGLGGAFGNRFGWYRDALEQRIGQKWRTNELDSRVRVARPVVMTFLIRRDGTIDDLRVEESSGNKALDYSAERAIREASPFPALPTAFERNEARVEFSFHLER
jgi:protein TonB